MQEFGKIFSSDAYNLELLSRDGSPNMTMCLWIALIITAPRSQPFAGGKNSKHFVYRSIASIIRLRIVQISWAPHLIVQDFSPRLGGDGSVIPLNWEPAKTGGAPLKNRKRMYRPDAVQPRYRIQIDFVHTHSPSPVFFGASGDQ